MKTRLPLSAALLLAASPVSAQHGGHAHGAHSPYAGQQNRQIKSLSAEDIATLRRGGGWGLAKAAELNGYPGPAHLLDLQGEIPLGDDQVQQIQVIFQQMQSDAQAEGAALIAHEKALDDAFADGTVNEETLAPLVEAAGLSLSRLRTIHLSAHLSAVAVLEADQIARYNSLRGYTQGTGTLHPAPVHQSEEHHGHTQGHGHTHGHGHNHTNH